MTLPIYNPSEVRLIDGAATSIAQQAKASAFQNLSSKMDMWSNNLSNDLAKQRAIEAEQQAYKDTLENKPLHQESVYTVYGQAYNSTRKATYLADTEINIKNKSDELAIKFKSDPDGYLNEMDGYLKGVRDETKVPDIEMAIGLTSKKVLDNTYNKLSLAKQEEETNFQRVKFEEYAGLKSSELINALSSRDIKSADLIRHSLDEYTTSLLQDGVITDAEYLKMTKDFEFTVNKGVLENEVSGFVDEKNMNGAKKIVDDFNKEIPKGYTPDQYKKVQASINTIYNQALVKQKAERVEYETSIKKDLRDGISVYDSGKIPFNSEQLDRMAMQLNPEDRRDYELSKQSYEIISKFDNLPLEEQQTYINKLESQQTGTKLSVDVLGKMKKVLNDKSSAAKNDPISLSIKDGLNKPTEAISINNDAMRNGDILKERAKMANVNIIKYGKGADLLLTDEEAKSLTSFVQSPTTATSDILAMIDTIETNVPDNADAIYRQINKKGAKLFSYVGGLVKTGNKEVAQNILTGNLIRQENKNAIMTKDVINDFNSEVGNALMYAGQGQREALMEATLSYAAYIAERTGELGEYADGKQALKGVLGGIGQRNDQNYILPFGKTEDDLEDYISELTPDMFPKEFKGMTKENAVKVIQDGQLISVGNGKYMVKYMNGFLYEAGNKPYILELK